MTVDSPSPVRLVEYDTAGFCLEKVYHGSSSLASAGLKFTSYGFRCCTMDDNTARVDRVAGHVVLGVKDDSRHSF